MTAGVGSDVDCVLCGVRNDVLQPVATIPNKIKLFLTASLLNRVEK